MAINGLSSCVYLIEKHTSTRTYEHICRGLLITRPTIGDHQQWGARNSLGRLKTILEVSRIAILSADKSRQSYIMAHKNVYKNVFIKRSYHYRLCDSNKDFDLYKLQTVFHAKRSFPSQ